MAAAEQGGGEPAIRARGLVKRFGGLTAVDHVDLFDTAIRVGLARARRQRSARTILNIITAIRDLAN